MGAVAGPLWTSRRLHPQSPAFLAAVDQSLLAAPGLVLESGRVLVKSGHIDDSFRLSSILSGREAALDHRPGSPWPGAGGQSQVLARRGNLSGSDHRAHPALLLYAGNALVPDHLLLSSYRYNDPYADRPGGRTGSALSQLQRRKPKQDRQRVRRHLLSGLKLSLYSWVSHSAGDRLSQREWQHFVATASRGLLRRFSGAFSSVGLAAGETGAGSGKGFRVVKGSVSSPSSVRLF